MPTVTTLDTGMAVWAYDLPGQYIWSVNLVMDLPLNAEPEGLDGLATIVARTLDEGTTPHPGPLFATELEEAGAQFSALVGLSTTQCLLDVPQDSVDAALALLAEAVAAPAFAEEDVHRIQANRLSEIDQQESRGSYVASSTLRRTILADHLRVGRPAGGSAQGVAAVTAHDVAAFHRDRYRARDAVLVLAGDMSGVDAAQAAHQAFGAWRPDATRVEPALVSAGAPRRRFVPREGSVQTDVRMGWFGVDRRDPRWAGLQVALAIMGGTFTSRLNTVLREERGYTYGVSMNAHPFRVGGIIDLATSTRTQAASSLIEETLEILAVREPFTIDEVRDAIGYLTLSAPLALDTAEAVASQGASLAAARLDLGYVTTALADLAAVTVDDAMEAYTDLIDPDRASVVAVADDLDLSGLGFEV